MKYTISDLKFTCPYCNLESKYRSKEINSLRTTEIVYCDSEDGGCDKEMVLHIKLKVLSEVKAFPIDGLYEKDPNTRIEDTGMYNAIKNILRDRDIKTMNDLTLFTKQEMLLWRNMGKKKVSDIERWMLDFDLKFKD